jgi:hypothetical protein
LNSGINTTSGDHPPGVDQRFAAEVCAAERGEGAMVDE